VNSEKPRTSVCGHAFLKRATVVVSGCRVVESRPLHVKTTKHEPRKPTTTYQRCVRIYMIASSRRITPSRLGVFKIEQI